MPWSSAYASRSPSSEGWRPPGKSTGGRPAPGPTTTFTAPPCRSVQAVAAPDTEAYGLLSVLLQHVADDVIVRFRRQVAINREGVALFRLLCAHFAAAAPAEPEMVEVWRPGRPPGSNQRRREAEKHGGRRHHRRHEGAKTGGQPAAEGAVAAAPAEGATSDATAAPAGERKEHHGRHRHRRHGGERKEGEGEQRADRQKRSDRNEKRNERGDRPDRKDRGPRRDRDRDRGPDRIWGSSEAPRSSKEPDPNSPFAKLLALKAQLENKPAKE